MNLSSTSYTNARLTILLIRAKPSIDDLDFIRMHRSYGRMEPARIGESGSRVLGGADVVAGIQAPDFVLVGDDGREHRLSDYRGKTVVLYFYPKDDSSDCTKEACAFRDSTLTVPGYGVQVIGVSNDGPESHARFRGKHSLNFPLFADADGSASKAYGVYKQFDFDGEKIWGIERSTFVIDEAGKVSRVMRGVNVDGHDKEVSDSV